LCLGFRAQAVGVVVFVVDLDRWHLSAYEKPHPLVRGRV